MRIFNDVNIERRCGGIFLALLFGIPFLLATTALFKITEKNNKTISTIERGYIDGFDYSIFVDKTTGKRYILRGGNSITELTEK